MPNNGMIKNIGPMAMAMPYYAMGGYKRWTFSETMDFLGYDRLSPSVVSAVCVAQN